MKKYKRLISIASSSSDSSADAPVAVKQKHEDRLFRHEEKACEFCDKVFYNQYDFHLHNAKHIIIPLQNINVYQCTVCLFHFTSLEELQFHSAVKHYISSSRLQKILDKQSLSRNIEKTAKEKVGNANLTKQKTKDKVPDILESIITKKPVVACDNSINALITKKNERNIECLVNKQPIIRCENVVTEFLKNNGGIQIYNGSAKKDNILESLKNNAEVWKDTKKKNAFKVKDKNKLMANIKAATSNVKNIESNLIMHENDTNNKKKINNNTPPSSIKSKIVFEDDSDLEIYEDDADFGEIPLMSNPSLIPNSPQKEIPPLKTFSLINSQKVIPLMSNQTFTPITTLKEIPLMSNQTFAPITSPLMSNQTFTPITTPLMSNQTFTPITTPLMSNQTFTPITPLMYNQTFIPTTDYPDTTIPNNFLQTDKGMDTEILDISSDESRDRNEDYILPDEGPQLFVPDPNYILPDCGPLLPVPPIESQDQPQFGKIVLGSKLPQTVTNDFVMENFAHQNATANYMHSFNTNLDINPTSISTPMLHNMLSNRVINVTSTSQPTFVPNTNNHKILLGKAPQDTVKYTPSVHYDDLMSPGLYTCKRCKKKYPTRLQLISHETSHVTIKTKIQPTACRNCQICDRYITGGHHGMKQHKLQNHEPYEINKNYTMFTCKKCNLKYRKMANHDYNYHKIFVCQKCGHRFEKEEERTSHLERKCFEAYKNTIEEDVKVLKVCELCLLFLKDKSNVIRYVLGGDFSESGKRQNCERCNKEFFELKIVKRIQRRRKYEHSEGKVKKSSNNARLMNIQNRLKNINKLSRR